MGSFSGSANAAELKFITLEVPPWAYYDNVLNKFVGIFPSLVEEIEKRSGHQIKITLAPYARINRELESARQDCTMLIRDDYRDRETKKGELILNHPMGVIAREGLSLNRYEDLKEMRISLLRGSTVSDKFDKDSSLKKDFSTNYNISLLKLKHGRLDAIAGAIPTIQYIAKGKGLGYILGATLELKSEPVFFQCSNHSKNIQYFEDINSVIKSMRLDSTLTRIIGADL
jgi:polar amino acid transport system substrate-binding protein